MEIYHYLPQTEITQENRFQPPAKESKLLRRKAVQYEPEFDRQKARELLNKKGSEEYESAEKAFEGFINLQLLTALGERFNRGISEFSYLIKDGKIVGEHSDEPFEDVLERGRAYRQLNGNPIDHARERAEVAGFRTMQAIMTDEATPIGTTVISVSPPGQEGSTYKHNFYDVFRKETGGIIKATRFSSALTPEETLDGLGIIDPRTKFPRDWDDVSLLSHPMRLDTKLTVEQIHNVLHKDHEVVSEDAFQQVTEETLPLRTAYIATLKEHPDDVNWQHTILNATWNLADSVVTAFDNGTYSRSRQSSHDYYSEDTIMKLGSLPVRQVMAACGDSGGFMTGETALGPYSVASFARPEDDPNLCHARECVGAKPHFHCGGDKLEVVKDKDGNVVTNEYGKEKKMYVSCDYKVIVGAGTKRCPECGKGAVC